MRDSGDRGRTSLWCAAMVCLLLGLGMETQAQAAEKPYEFSAELSLTGGCGTSKPDPIPDPGCPEKHPPLPFKSPEAIAIDSFGDEYVAVHGASESGSEGRIDIFGPEGVYVGELKDPFSPRALAVDAEGNLYVFEGHEGEIVRYAPTAYKPNEGKIAYDPKQRFLLGATLASVDGLAVDAKTGHVFAGNGNEIHEFGSAAEENKLLATITDEKLHSAVWVAVDAQRRRLYASSCPVSITECVYLVFNADAPHELLKEIDGSNTPEGKFLTQKGFASVAVDEETGAFFIGDIEFKPERVYQFDEHYEFVSQLPLSSSLYARGDVAEGIAVSNAAGAFNHHYLFVASPGTNRALAFSPPPEEAEPAVTSLSAVVVGEDEAELQATIKPGGLETNYRVEYLSQQAYEEAGDTFAGAEVAGEGTIPPSGQAVEVKAAISGLEPGTAYRFRAVAENELGEDEKEASFTTYDDAPVTRACENQALRLAHSALLPDCRAYELVTPPDTNGRPPKGVGFGGDRFSTVENAPGGSVVSFLIEGGIIPGAEGTGSFNGDLYRTTRSDSGWGTASAGPGGAEAVEVQQGSTSPDQGYSFWFASREGPAVIEGKATHYVRYPDGHSALIGRGNLGTDPRALGELITEGGSHIVFQTRSENGEQPIQLEEDAPPTGTAAVYDRTPDEVTHVVSLLPGDVTPAAGEDALYIGASADGEGIAFEIKGTLYLRVADAATYKVGSGVKFAGISEGGRRIFYVEGGDLFAFDTETEEAIPFSETGNAVPVNVSPDGIRAYFASTTAIEGSGENPNGDAAIPPAEGSGTLVSGSKEVTGVAGSFVPGMGISGTGIPAGTEITAVDAVAHTLTLSKNATALGSQLLSAVAENLYLSEEGAIRFVGTVTERDMVGENPGNGQLDGLSLWILGLGTGQLSKDPSRTNPDGSVLLFSSRADLTGYAHQGVPELYRYDSVGDRLHCISCIPTKTPATGGSSLESVNVNQGDPAPFSPQGFVQNLRADGKRVFFQSTEALVSRDNDEVQDVYEWEEQGQGSCTRSGGCVYLISSGGSSSDNFLYGIGASGDDVFFTTLDILVGGDDDTLSIYDARVNGGFEEIPCQQPGECTSEKPPTPPPLFPAPESEGASGPQPVVPPKHCPKGKHKVKRHGKKVCVKNKHHRKHSKTKKGAGK